MKVLIVCLGNICRSPMGEGALRAQLDKARLSRRIEVDSAGTGIGMPAIRRTRARSAARAVTAWIFRVFARAR